MPKFETDEMTEGVRVANKLVVDHLKGGKTTGVKCGSALKYLSTYRGLRQAENNESHIQVEVLGGIANDKKEFREFIELAQPRLIPKRALK